MTGLVSRGALLTLALVLVVAFAPASLSAAFVDDERAGSLGAGGGADAGTVITLGPDGGGADAIGVCAGGVELIGARSERGE